MLISQSKTSNLIARISITDTGVSVRYPEKNEDLIAVVKHLGYRFEYPLWIKQTTEKETRAVEVAHRLILTGFCVDIADILVQRVIDADYEPECFRWVKAMVTGKFSGWLRLIWAWEDDLYNQAMRLPGARYCKPNVVVPSKSYRDILDFADIHHFGISEKAQQILDNARKQTESIFVFTPKPIPERKSQSTQPDNFGIADELLDTD